jgi:uncharacterized membrane protein
MTYVRQLRALYKALESSQPELVRKNIRFSLAALIALVGIADALFLTIKHLNGEALRCTVTSGCDEVLSSPFATLAGLPLPVLGLTAYLMVFSLAVLAVFGYRFAEKFLAPLVLIMLGMTCWLLYVQAFILQHFCQYCLISAAVTISISGLILPGPIFSLFQRKQQVAVANAGERHT